MTGYAVRLQELRIGRHEYTIRSLRDRQQYSDPDGLAGAKGISSASWGHFGQLWPASLALAEHMDAFALHGRRVLEVGCGLAVPGLVLHRRGSDVAVSDRHPECPGFLRENLRLNGLGPLTFLDVDWSQHNPTLGRFDLIIGSDVLYDRGHPGDLATLFDRHTTLDAEVLLVDPRRGGVGELSRRMAGLGFVTVAPQILPRNAHRLVHFRRT